jgi:hypothetical protein
MDRAAGDLSANVGRLRMMEAAKLDAAADAIFARVLDGDLNAHRTWLANRGRHATLLGLDAREAGGGSMGDVQVTINTAPPWDRSSMGAPLVVEHEAVLAPPAPDSYPEPPFA